MSFFDRKTRDAEDLATAAEGPWASEENMANIGKSITIKGDLSGNEDLVVEGHVEGKVELPSNQLTIGAEGTAAAEIHAKHVVIVGKVTGNVSASERIEIQSSGFVDGDVRAPRLVVEEGAVVNGSISMESPSGAPRPASPQAPEPAQPETGKSGLLP